MRLSAEHILDALITHAKTSSRLRMNLNLRNSPEDQSQRMLNAIEQERYCLSIDMVYGGLLIYFLPLRF